jgi:hypothetical protein
MSPLFTKYPATSCVTVTLPSQFLSDLTYPITLASAKSSQHLLGSPQRRPHHRHRIGSTSPSPLLSTPPHPVPSILVRRPHRQRLLWANPTPDNEVAKLMTDHVASLHFSLSHTLSIPMLSPISSSEGKSCQWAATSTFLDVLARKRKYGAVVLVEGRHWLMSDWCRTRSF